MVTEGCLHRVTTKFAELAMVAQVPGLAVPAGAFRVLGRVCVAQLLQVEQPSVSGHTHDLDRPIATLVEAFAGQPRRPDLFDGKVAIDCDPEGGWGDRGRVAGMGAQGAPGSGVAHLRRHLVPTSTSRT